MNKVCRIVLPVLFLLLGPLTSYSQESPQAAFDRANEQLQKGQFQKALSLYQSLEDQNKVSGALFLNMGLAYQLLDSLGKAKFYFLKASRFEETRERGSRALKAVETQFSRQSSILPQLPWDRATKWLQHHVGVGLLLAFGIILFNIGIIFYVVGWFVNRFSNYLQKGGVAVIILSVLTISASLYTRYVADRYSTGVMVTEKVAVRDHPEAEASLISQAYEGYAFTVDHYRSESQADWYYVRMSNGLYGWIPSRDLMVL